MNLYISDLDGTLLNKNQELSISTVKRLNKLIADGLNFSIATARSMDSVKKIIKPLNLKLPFIIFNGVLIYDPISETVLRLNSLNKLIVKEILVELYNLNPFVFVPLLDGNNKIYYKGAFNSGEERFLNSDHNKNESSFEKISSYDELEFEEYLSVTVINTKEKLEPIYNLYKTNSELEVHLTEDIYIEGYYWLEFSKAGSTKKGGVLFLKEMLNATRLITFGDNLNDVSMFNVADESYAVENAHLTLKLLATKIIGSNIEDGVVNFIESNYLKMKD